MSNIEWSDSLVNFFLEEVQKRPCLWMTSCRAFKNKLLRAAAFQEIADLLAKISHKDVNLNVVRDKYKSLKCYYTSQLLKVLESQQSGMSGDNVYTPTVPWFEKADAFLRPHADFRKRSKNSDLRKGSEKDETSYPNSRYQARKRKTYADIDNALQKYRKGNVVSLSNDAVNEQNETVTSQSVSTAQQGFTSENSVSSSEECTNEEHPPTASPQKFLHEKMEQTPPVNTFTPQRLESYKLIHNNHLNFVLESLAKDESFMNVTLTAQSMSIKAHKSVLSAVSPYFKNVLKENPCQHPIIIMPRDVKYQELCSIINYIYKGEVTVPANELCSILKTADILQITGLSSADTNNNDENNLPNLFQNPIILTQPVPLASAVTPTNVKRTPKKQNVTGISQHQSIWKNSESDANKINPLDFLSANMTWVKQEVQSDSEENTENDKSNIDLIQGKESVAPANTDDSFSPLEKSSNLNQTTASSNMERVLAVNTDHISSKSCSAKDSLMDVSVLGENIRTTTQPPKNQTLKNNSISNVSGHPSVSFSTGPIVCPYCFESHESVDVLETHLRLKHQTTI